MIGDPNKEPHMLYICGILVSDLPFNVVWKHF